MISYYSNYSVRNQKSSLFRFVSLIISTNSNKFQNSEKCSQAKTNFHSSLQRISSMHILCGGVIDGSTSVITHSLSSDCLDPQPAGKLAAQLLSDLLSSSSISSATAIRQVSYPSVPDLRRALTTPIPACVLEGKAPSSTSNNTNQNNNNKPSPFTAFTTSIGNQLLFEAEEYVKSDGGEKNDDESAVKICTSAAFIFHRFAFSKSSSSSDQLSASSLIVGGGGGTSAQNISSISLWLMCHLLPEVGATGNATRRILDLTSAATILSRWAEMCVMEDTFRSAVVKSVAGASSSSSNSENVNGAKFSDGALAVAVCSLDEAAGEFDDARHASVELRFAPES